MRYRGSADLGLTEAQIRDNLLFTRKRSARPMRRAMDPKVAKAASASCRRPLARARSRSPDWLYTYLRSFYRDPAPRSGWNNTVFPNVAMPHVLWDTRATRPAGDRARGSHSGDTVAREARRSTARLDDRARVRPYVATW
jgi:ubiquinol-cytochrome c reductase cytochrome c1 subunit